MQSQFWPKWHRLIAVALFLAMIWTEYKGPPSDGRWGEGWFGYPFIFFHYSVVWFALFVMEQWDLGPFTRPRFCYLSLFLGLFVYGIVRIPSAFFGDGFGGQ